MSKTDEAVENQLPMILVVDDNPANLSVVVDYLAEHGFQIMIARNGETALRLAQQNYPDLILLDVLLPGIDGFEVCRRLKADERTREISVLFMTIVTKTEDKVKGFEVGGVDYITKPFQHEEVLARVTTHLRLRRLAQEIAEVNKNLERQVAERTAELRQANARLQKEITERERVEEASVHERALLRTVIDLLPDSIYAKDMECRKTLANLADLERMGMHSEAEALGRTDFDVFSYAVAARFYADDQLVLQTGQPLLNREEIIDTGDGQVHWLLTSKVPLRNSAGQVVGLVGVGRDITVRKQTEEALEQERNLLRTLINHLPDQIYVKDAAGRFLIANAATARVMGATTPDALLGKTDRDFYPASSATEYETDEQLILQTGEALIDKDEPKPDSSGTFRDILTTKLPLRDAQGQIAGLVGISRDITERKRAEEEIRRLNQDLEQRVLDRTAQLEAANQELEAFAYSVSHDLRAPLRHIDGFLELLQQRLGSTLDEHSQHYMQMILSSVKRLGVLIDELLSFSRMRRQEVSWLTVDLNELAWEVIRDFEPETSNRNICWRVAELPVIRGDRAMLRVVLVNLLSNALKFTQPRTLVEIEIGYTHGANETVFFVRDNGVGFDMQYVDKLFGVFQRLHRADEFEGTGIGLANVRRIIARHGGRTWAKGAVDHGATFYFSLPHPSQGA